MPSSPSQNPDEPSGLLKILGAVSSGFLFGWFLSQFKTPIQESIETIHPQDSTTNQIKCGEDVTSSPVRVIVDSPPPPHAPDKEQRAKDHRRERRERWILVANWATALVALGLLIVTAKYAAYTYQMWREMQQQTCIQRNAAMNAERAWVGLDGTPSVEIGLLEDRKRMGAAINFTVKNYGKGPALSVMAGARIVPSGTDNRHVVEDALESTCDLLSPFVGVKPTRPVSSDEDLMKHQWGHVVFPNQPFGTGTVTTIDLPKMIGKEVYVVGCIVYRDQFSEPHWTKFCYNTGDFAKDAVKDTASFKHLYMCNANNYTDEIEKKPPACPVTE
jgi:hypothetical protein